MPDSKYELAQEPGGFRPEMSYREGVNKICGITRDQEDHDTVRKIDPASRRCGLGHLVIRFRQVGLSLSVRGASPGRVPGRADDSVFGPGARTIRSATGYSESGRSSSSPRYLG